MVSFLVWSWAAVTFLIMNQGGLFSFQNAANPIFVFETSPFKMAFMTAEQYASTTVTALSDTIGSAINITNMTNSNGTAIASTLISTSSSTSGWDVSLVYWMRSVGDTRMVSGPTRNTSFSTNFALLILLYYLCYVCSRPPL